MIPSFLQELERSARSLGGDAAELFEAHVRLARYELDAAIGCGKRLAIGGAVAATLAIVALAAGTSALAEALDGVAGWPTAAWLSLFAGVEMLLGAAIGWYSWRRFQRDYVGFADSQAEMAASLEALVELLRHPQAKE